MEINIVNKQIHDFAYFATHKTLIQLLRTFTTTSEQEILFLTIALPHNLPCNLTQVFNLMTDILPGCLIWDQKRSSLLSACSKRIKPVDTEANIHKWLERKFTTKLLLLYRLFQRI